ncbi:hypothetical protein E4U41_000729 [Claviceps citrina]|nr:hypothetical protein E4U41_000729 [Claviceps citrina]
MKFSAAVLALAAAAMASPTIVPAHCDTCKYDHHPDGYGRYQGEKKHCDNWVPVDSSLVALDVHADICLNLEVDILGLIQVDLSASVDVEIDLELLRSRYPSCQRLVCDPTYSCKKGEKVPMEKCWEHEFDEGKYNKYY